MTDMAPSPPDLTSLTPPVAPTRLPDITAPIEAPNPTPARVPGPRQTVVTVTPLIADFAAAHHRLPTDPELRDIVHRQGWQPVSATEADFAVEILRFRGQAYVR